MVLFEKWLPRGSVGAAVLARSQAAAAPTTLESSTPRGSVGAAILARSQAAAAASADELVEPQPPVGGRVFYRFSCCLCEHDIWLNFKPVPSQPVAGEFEPSFWMFIHSVEFAVKCCQTMHCVPAGALGTSLLAGELYVRIL